LVLVGCVVGDPVDEVEPDVGILAATSTVALKPTADRWVSGVEGVGDATNLYANVDDGTAFTAADNNTSYVRSAAGQEWGRHAVGFSGAPAGRVTRVDVNFRAGNGGASGATVKVLLIDDTGIVKSSSERPLTSYANFTESFTGLSIADANAMRVRVELHNPSLSSQPRYTMLWVNATIESTPALKAPVRGLLTREGLPDVNFDFIDYAVVHVDWKDLQPTVTGPIDWRTVDDQLAKLAARGVKGTRVRVYTGRYAPTWVKKLYGPAVSTSPGEALNIDCSAEGGIAVINPQTPTGGCVPYFWRPMYLDAYDKLMVAFAQRYDNNDMVREVVDSACMTVYAEPFYRAHGNTASNKRLWDAGLSPTADRACHERAIQIHNRVFVRTRTAIAINTWDLLDPTQPDYQRGSWPDAHSFVTWARDLMGQKLELQNNGLGESSSDRCNLNPVDPAASYWCYLKSVDGPKGFQTETWDRLAEGGGTGENGLYMALDNALSMGANSVELPGGYSNADKARLLSYDTSLSTTPCCGP
jgi:hypothetical protein